MNRAILLTDVLTVGLAVRQAQTEIYTFAKSQLWRDSIAAARGAARVCPQQWGFGDAAEAEDSTVVPCSSPSLPKTNTQTRTQIMVGAANGSLQVAASARGNCNERRCSHRPRHIDSPIGGRNGCRSGARYVYNLVPNHKPGEPAPAGFPGTRK
jgi:hypothetical protein